MEPPAPRRGEIWFVWTPGQPYDPNQPRPALVASENTRNRLTDDLVVVPIFSTGQLGPTRVPIISGTGGVPRDGVVFCEEITTIHREFLERGPLGPPVPEQVMDEVIRAVRRALGEVVI